MKKLFDYFTISIFDGNGIESVSKAIEHIYKNDMNKFNVYISKLIAENYFNPPSGGAHFPQFCIWSNKKYPQKTFLISNYQDGLSSLCNVIHRHVKGNHILCSISNENSLEYPKYHFHYSNAEFEERDVVAYKEDRWVFYDRGVPLPIENLDFYKNRFIKKRLNAEIIEEYLLKLGIYLWDIDSNVEECIVYKRYIW